MKKISYLAYALLLLLTTVALPSCNKNNEEEESETYYGSMTTTSTLVSNFYFKSDANVIDHLDSVFFSIDQERCVIYNADSLPVGTKVTALLPVVSFPSTVSSAKFIVKGGKVQSDTTITYTSSSTDSIDFSGNVQLQVTSNDGQYTRTYTIKVNVHQTEPDELYWSQLARRDLPNVTGTVKAVKAVQRDADNYYCLMLDGGDYVLSHAAHPAQGTWDKQVLSFPFTPDVNSFTATSEAFYLLDTEGNLYRSDDCTAWTSCGVKWSWLIGAYGDKVLGVNIDGGEYRYDEYPRASGYALQVIDPEFPVKGGSALALASNEWTDASQASFMGGVKSDGSLSNLVWGYDGTRWGQVSNTSQTNVLPALSGAMLIPYVTYKVSTTNFKAEQRVTWLVLGGRTGSGSINNRVYASYNQGITWQVGFDGLQLPTHVTPGADAQAFVLSKTLKASSNVNVWRGLPLRVESTWAHSIMRKAASDRTQPVTEWECPYIYVFGGTTASGEVLNNVWTAVLTRLTYKPVF